MGFSIDILLRSNRRVLAFVLVESGCLLEAGRGSVMISPQG